MLGDATWARCSTEFSLVPFGRCDYSLRPGMFKVPRRLRHALTSATRWLWSEKGQLIPQLCMGGGGNRIPRHGLFIERDGVSEHITGAPGV